MEAWRRRPASPRRERSTAQAAPAREHQVAAGSEDCSFFYAVGHFVMYARVSSSERLRRRNCGLRRAGGLREGSR
eukprot:9481938-Pyramimonas_sp.AAC.1